MVVENDVKVSSEKGSRDLIGRNSRYVSEIGEKANRMISDQQAIKNLFDLLHKPLPERDRKAFAEQGIEIDYFWQYFQTPDGDLVRYENTESDRTKFLIKAKPHGLGLDAVKMDRLAKFFSSDGLREEAAKRTVVVLGQVHIKKNSDDIGANFKAGSKEYYIAMLRREANPKINSGKTTVKKAQKALAEIEAGNWSILEASKWAGIFRERFTVSNNIDSAERQLRKHFSEAEIRELVRRLSK